MLKHVGAMTGSQLQGNHCIIYSHETVGQAFGSHACLMVPLLTNSRAETGAAARAVGTASLELW